MIKTTDHQFCEIFYHRLSEVFDFGGQLLSPHEINQTLSGESMIDEKNQSEMFLVQIRFHSPI